MEARKTKATSSGRTGLLILLSGLITILLGTTFYLYANRCDLPSIQIEKRVRLSISSGDFLVYQHEGTVRISGREDDISLQWLSEKGRKVRVRGKNLVLLQEELP